MEFPTLAATVFWLGVATGSSLLPAQEPAARPVSEACAELPFGSFPPNQLLRQGTPNGSAFSQLQSGKPGTWGEFFIQVDQPGTYRVDVDLLKGPARGIFQLLVNGDAIGDPIDCYASGADSDAVIPVGAVTFLKPENNSFRFRVTGKNGASAGSELALQRITLTPVHGFTLLSPNGSCQAKGDVLLRWNSWPQASHYRVEVDGSVATTLDASATTWQATGLVPGPHRWRVVAVGADGKTQPSNVLTFVVGTPPPYPCREFSDDFSSLKPGDWSLDSMKLSQDGGASVLEGTGPAAAVRESVRLDKTEGEVSAKINAGGANSVAGVGFQADDGTQLCAVVDLSRNQLRLERRLQGSNRYSIFDVTPKAYRVKGWAERNEGDAIVWEIAAKPITLPAGTSYVLKLAYSRRSGCIMATLVPSDGSPAVTLRDLTDLRTPDHPVLVSLSGKASFGDVSLRLLNKLVYKWDPDSIRIVLRPGEPGSWDAKGAYNPAVIVRNGTWSMVYRGNQQPAPPNGPIGSELGLATSTDGVHWVRSPANPIIRKENGKGAAEDPDLIWPKGSTQVDLEYVSFHLDLPQSNTTDASGKSKTPSHAELMRSSSDFIHWSDPWILNIGKTWGKMGGFIDTQNEPALPAIQSGGTAYRYVSMIEEGRIDLSNDLHQWIKAGTADLKGTPEAWCTTHECSGDIFVDHDGNIRYESQIGVKPESGHGGGIVGNRLCTIGEGVLSGSDPTKVLWKSDLPWLTDWYGDAPTGAPENFTATNGSVFPGQTIVKDGWLWHFSGGNNHCVLLSKCWYGPLLECRDLQAATDAAGQCSVRVIVRNTGSLAGTGTVTLSIDGQPVAEKHPVLDRDAEQSLAWKVPVPAGIHTLSVDDLAVTLKR
jgi:hypothetical protein